MKKIVLTLIVAFSFCGSILAQQYEQSHWPDFNHHNFQFQGGLVAAISINGHVYTVEDDGWDLLEAAAFVGDVCRGNNLFMTDAYVIEYGDPYPVFDALPIYYDNGGEVVSFKLYDHSTGIEYDNCEITYLDEPMTILTGEEHYEAWLDEPYLPIILNFTSPGGASETFTRTIAGYGTNEEGNWYLISSPIGEVAATDVANMTTGTYDLYYFDQAQDLEWINYEDQNDGGFNLIPGKGYLYANSVNVTLSFTGTPYDGNGEVTLVKVEGAEFAGWNLVGNPFGETANIGDRDFYVVNEAGTEIVPAETEAIEPMQGIFVIAEENGETLTFSTNTAIAMKSRLALNLICNNNVVDRAIVNFGKGTLPKFQLNPNSTKIYIPMEGKDYAVVNAGEMGEMPVNFKAEKNGSYTLSLTTQEVSFAYLHLIDNMTGADQDLLETPTYTFNAQTTDYASRFRLVFATGSSIDGDSFGFINGAGNLSIFGIEGEATVQVVDVLGHVLSSETFSGSYEKHLDVAPGVYMIRLIQGNDVKVQKMVIK